MHAAIVLLAAVLARPLRDATVVEVEAAIGGFVIFNDLSARDVQWREHRQGLFGSLGKAKSFANALGAEVDTADELLTRLGDLRGRTANSSPRRPPYAPAAPGRPSSRVRSAASS